MGKKYTGWNIQKVTIFIGIMNSLLFFSERYVDQNKCRFKKPLHLGPPQNIGKKSSEYFALKIQGDQSFVYFLA